MKKKIADDSAQFKIISSEQLNHKSIKMQKKIIAKNYQKIDNIL